MNLVNITKLNSNLEKINKNFGIVIGNFDGVHLGHQHHLNQFIMECRKLNVEPVLITFYPHPKEFFNPQIESFYLTSNKTKMDLIAQLGVDNVILLEFDTKLQGLCAEEFFKRFIINHKNLKLIHLGHDFKLGEGKEDATELIRSITEDKGIQIVQSKAFVVEENVLSSTFIRSILNDSLDKIEKYLGRKYSIIGKVIRGKGLGKKSLFPTCNLGISTKFIIPETGVYISKVRFRNKLYDSITNIGQNPSTDFDSKVKIETHIFFFDLDIYDEEIELFFYKKIRDERKFEDLNKLRSQISKDIEQARGFHRRHSSCKLALVGKNISHSKSQDMYEKLLKKFVNYSLVDCDSEFDIPSLDELKEQFQGVSITAPYKRHFLDKVQIENTKLDSINAIVFKNNDYLGINTDYLAAKEILSDLYLKYNFSQTMILGSGAMYTMFEKIFGELEKPFLQISRKQDNFDAINDVLMQTSNKTLIINACSRDFTFKLGTFKNFVFWDLNYNLAKHSDMFKNGNIEYIDGIGLLELQAKYALSFWKI